MTLRRQLLIASLLLALPVALAVSWAVDRLRDRDRRQVLERVAEGHLTDAMRDACLDNPAWFLAGPRAGRPTAAERAMPDADVYLPRPSADELPFEVFAYDEQFQPSSSAGPRFPVELRRGLRGRQAGFATGVYPSRTGEGVETAIVTGWSPGPCAVFLFRIRPEAGSRWLSWAVFGGVFALVFGAAMLVALPTEMRLRRLAGAARRSARAEYGEMVPVGGRDEIGAIGAVFNEAAADIRRRAVDVRDREDALQRHVSYTTDDVTLPMTDLARQLATLEAAPDLDESVRADLQRATRDAHQLTARLNNLAAVVRLRTRPDPTDRAAVDIAALVDRVVSARQGLARSLGVALELSRPASAVMWNGDAVLLEQAIGNVVDNAVLHNRAGGRVRVELRSYDREGRFALRVTDDGPGVTDETFAGLTANRRFRGDEGRAGRGGRGLGLAVACEVADRSGLQLDLRRPSTGGFEVEFAVR